MTSATQTSPSFPLVVPTKTASPTARLLVRNEAGQVVQQWLVKNTKCTLGSSTSCALRCTLPGIAPFHALLVIGARQTFVRALAPQVTRGGNAVTEVLLSGSQNHFELAGHRFELERNPSTQTQTPEEQRRLKFTLARPFSLQSRGQVTNGKEAAPTLPNTIAEKSPVEANESSQWVAKLVQSAIEPLECQIQNVLEPIAELRTQAEQQRELLRQYNEGTPVSPSETLEHDVHLDLSEFLKASDENIDSRLQEFASEQSVVLEVLGERLADVTNQLGAIERIVQNEENQEATTAPIPPEQSAAFDELHDQVQKVAKSIQELENRHVSSDADDAQWRDEICHQVGTLRESLTGLAQQTGESLREITRQTEESIGQLSDRTQNSIQALSQQAEQGLEDLRDSNEENWNKLNSRTNSLFVKAEKLAAQTDALSSSTEQLSAQTGELTEQTSTLSDKTELLAEEAGQLSEKTDQLVSRTNNISTQTTEGFREVLERLESPTTPTESEAQWRQGVQEQFTQLRETLNNLVSLPLATTAGTDSPEQGLADESAPIQRQESGTSAKVADPDERDSVAPPNDEIESEPVAESATYQLDDEMESSSEPGATPEIAVSPDPLPSSYEDPITEKEFSPGDTTVTIEDLNGHTEELNAPTIGAVEEPAETDSADLEYQQTESPVGESVELDPDFTADSLLSRARDVETDMQNAADLDFFATTSGNAWESSEGIVEPEEIGSEPDHTEDSAATPEQPIEDAAAPSSPEPEVDSSPDSNELETATQDVASNEHSWWQDGDSEEEDFFGLGSDTTENNFQDKDFFADSPSTTESWMEDAAPTELASDFQLDEPAAKTTDSFDDTSTDEQGEEFFGLGSMDSAPQADEPETDSYSPAVGMVHEHDSSSEFEAGVDELSSTADHTDEQPGSETEDAETEQDSTPTLDTEERPLVAEQRSDESGDLPSWWTSETPDESFAEQGSDRIESFESQEETEEESWTPPAFESVDTSSVDSISAESASIHTDHFSDNAEEQAYESELSTDSGYESEYPNESDSAESSETEQAIVTEPEQEPQASSPPSSEASSLESSDEESIEDYMKQLLARMRGEPSVEAPAPQEDSRPKEPSLAALKLGLQDEDDEEDEVASAPEPSPENYTPRVLAPEKVQSLAAMRELANSSARTAIHKSSRQRNTRDVVLKGSISLIGFAVGMILLYLNGLAVNLVLVASVTSFAFSLIWGVDAATTLLPLLQLETNSPEEPSEPEDEDGDEPESLSQSDSDP